MRMSPIIALLCCLVAGCSLPATSVRSVDSRPSLAIKGTSPSAELLIDGLNMGKAEAFNGDPQVLTIEPGTHKVSVVDHGRTVYEQNIFVESELKTITVK